MGRYIDAEKLEKDGWWASRAYQQDAKTNVYETKKMTDFPIADVVEKQTWIPVTNRLPKEKQDVLLAYKHNMVVGFWENIMGEVTWYANNGDGWFSPAESVDNDGIPLAWMPLPEPYREEKEDE